MATRKWVVPAATDESAQVNRHLGFPPDTVTLHAQSATSITVRAEAMTLFPPHAGGTLQHQDDGTVLYTMRRPSLQSALSWTWRLFVVACILTLLVSLVRLRAPLPARDLCAHYWTAALTPLRAWMNASDS